MNKLKELCIMLDHYDYDTMDIAERLTRLAFPNDDLEMRKDIENRIDIALFNLQSTAQNSYNDDCFRVLWNVLQQMMECDLDEGGLMYEV